MYYEGHTPLMDHLKKEGDTVLYSTLFELSPEDRVTRFEALLQAAIDLENDTGGERLFRLSMHAVADVHLLPIQDQSSNEFGAARKIALVAQGKKAVELCKRFQSFEKEGSKQLFSKTLRAVLEQILESWGASSTSEADATAFAAFLFTRRFTYQRDLYLDVLRKSTDKHVPTARLGGAIRLVANLPMYALGDAMMPDSALRILGTALTRNMGTGKFACMVHAVEPLTEMASPHWGWNGVSEGAWQLLRNAAERVALLERTFAELEKAMRDYIVGEISASFPSLDDIQILARVHTAKEETAHARFEDMRKHVKALKERTEALKGIRISFELQAFRNVYEKEPFVKRSDSITI